ncbi:MAG TPA: DUF5916 domain-containing protein [Gemmatimonadaceae bacterium]|nr:DUF5916 domain-containing protein [Gemmatimonadaceae bacterium]
MSPRLLSRGVAALIVLGSSLAELPAQTSAGAPSAPAATTARAMLRAGRDVGIRLDGILDDRAWSGVDSIGPLTQTEPREGVTPSAGTIVKVVATGDALTIGIRADQPPGVRIVSFARDRDAALGNEDHVRVVLDTYLDGRSGYVFAVNPNGARYDALVANQGEGESSDWDGIWEAATARTPTGWSVEIRIPIKTLLFRQQLTEWGFNVQRRIQALQETDRWASPMRQFQITHVNRAGLLGGLPPFELGRGLSFRPSLTTGARRALAEAGTVTDAAASLDASQRIRGNTLASLTVNTDFGETEVDTRRTNLTRFPLFFPEKRTFFVEGSDIFQFGLGTGDDVRAFHSRRIGLLSEREVPLNAGVKITGRERSTNFGALVVRTGHADDPLLDTLRTDNTMTVLRVQQNVLRQSSVGVIASVGDPLGAGNAWLVGPDLTYQTSRFRGDKNFLAGLWGLAMDRDGLMGDNRAWGGKIDYPNDLWDVALTYKWLGEGFQPPLGFVPRPGVQILNVNVVYQPRPPRPVLGLHVRQMFNEFLTRLVTDPSGHWESYRVFMAPVNWRLESGDRFEFNVVPTGERLSGPFDIAENVVIPGGDYHWNRYRLEAGLAAKRRFSAQATWWFGRFYTGDLDEMILTASWKPSSLFIVELNGTRNVGRLPQGDFTQEVIGSRFRFNVSPDLQVNSYVQYDNDSRLIGTNTRLRWTFSPVGDLFVVYNHNIRELLDTYLVHRGYGFDSNQLLVKLQYAFRY